jgi:hypothetical protein
MVTRSHFRWRRRNAAIAIGLTEMLAGVSKPAQPRLASPR